MHTPAHVAYSLFFWRHAPGWGAVSAVTLGALLPDLPMFGFFAYERFWVRATGREIWSTLYFADHWQFCFDIFNSIPLAILLMAVCKAYGSRWGSLCAASALLHMLCDLPVHHDDAHRHFLPVSDWRFISPVSYWDFRHYGQVVVWIELALALGACVCVIRTTKHRPMRFAALGTLSLYAVGLVLTVAVLLPRWFATPT